MLRATLKSMLSRKRRLILSTLAVVLGVMFVSGAFVLTDTLNRSPGASGAAGVNVSVVRAGSSAAVPATDASVESFSVNVAVPACTGSPNVTAGRTVVGTLDAPATGAAEVAAGG